MVCVEVENSQIPERTMLSRRSWLASEPDMQKPFRSRRGVCFLVAASVRAWDKIKTSSIPSSVVGASVCAADKSQTSSILERKSFLGAHGLASVPDKAKKQFDPGEEFAF